MISTNDVITDVIPTKPDVVADRRDRFPAVHRRQMTSTSLLARREPTRFGRSSRKTIQDQGNVIVYDRQRTHGQMTANPDPFKVPVNLERLRQRKFVGEGFMSGLGSGSGFGGKMVRNVVSLGKFYGNELAQPAKQRRNSSLDIYKKIKKDSMSSVRSGRPRDQIKAIGDSAGSSSNRNGIITVQAQAPLALDVTKRDNKENSTERQLLALGYKQNVWANQEEKQQRPLADSLPVTIRNAAESTSVIRQTSTAGCLFNTDADVKRFRQLLRDTGPRDRRDDVSRLNHVNYCDREKTKWILRWLGDLNVGDTPEDASSVSELSAADCGRADVK